MSEPFLAEVRIVGFNFAPRGWAFCDGQLLPITQNHALFSLLGTTYGGDGRTSFGLPDLRGRTPIHVGSSGGATYPLGQQGGEEHHTLSGAEMPQHTHAFNVATANATGQQASSASDSVLAGATVDMYRSGAASTPLVPATISSVGAGHGHDNMQPTLVVSFCIALQGLFPSRS